MAKALFRRYARLVVDTLDVTGLDFSFSIEKTLEEKPNRLELVVYNLSESHRKALQKKTSIPFALHLGYLGVEQETSQGTTDLTSTQPEKASETLLFKGILQSAFTMRDGPDWITIIRASDKGEVHTQARLNKSYAKDIPYATIAQDLINKMSLDNKAALAKIAGRNYTGGNTNVLNSYVVSGSVSRELRRLLDRFELSYSIQNGELVILAANETRNSNPIKLSPDSGLIGSPEPGKDGVVKMRSLILPQLTVGKKVKLESVAFNGFFKIEKAVYNGSTFGNEWYIDMDGKPV